MTTERVPLTSYDLALLQVVLDGASSLAESARRAGVSRGGAYSSLEKLRRLGLVEWEPWLAGTLRPSCRVVR